MSEIELHDTYGQGYAFDAYFAGRIVGSARWLKPGRWGYQVEGRATRYVRRRRAATRGLLRASRRAVVRGSNS